MSRIGKKIIPIPEKVTVSVVGNVLTAKGPNGEQMVNIPKELGYELEGNTVVITRGDESKYTRSIHGLTRALAANAINGVGSGFEKILRITGVGYKAELKNDRLFMSLGFSHPVMVIPPKGISFEIQNPTTVVIKGADKQLVGEVSSKIKRLRPPEPYKGKGIRYEGEHIRRKAGKTSSK